MIKRSYVLTVLILTGIVLALVIANINSISIILFGKYTPELWDKYPYHRHHMISQMEQEIDIYSLSYEETIDALGQNELSEYEDANIITLEYIAGKNMPGLLIYGIRFDIISGCIIDIYFFTLT